MVLYKYQAARLRRAPTRKTGTKEQEMKLKDLIADLQKQNQEADVVVVTDDGIYSIGWMPLKDGRISIQTGSKIRGAA